MRKIDAYFESLSQRWSWLSFWITLCMVLFAVGSMLSMVWLERGVSMRVARVVTLLAFVLGWWLARKEARWWMVLLFSTLLGGLVIASQYARVGDELVRAFEELVFYIKTFYTAWRNETQGPGTFLFMQPLYEYAKGMFTMLSRLASRLLDLPETRRDGLARVMTWELGLWLSIIWLNWSIWRKSWILLGLVPGLVLGGYVIAVSHGSTLAYSLTFGAAIILIILYSQQMRERSWERNLVGYSEYIREHSTRAALTLSVSLVFISGLIASIDFEALIERVREYRQGITGSTETSRELEIRQQASFDDQRRTLSDEFNELSSGGFPMVNLIGSGPELAEHVVLYADVDELNASTGQYQRVEQGPLYLRALTFERYNSHGWFSDTRRVYLYDPGQEAVWVYSTNQRLLRQEVTFVNDFSGLLNAVGQLAVVNTEYTIAWREGSSQANFKDMVGAMVPRGEYTAYSLTPAFGEEELRTVSENYPEWVADRYLALPESVPVRVFELANEITANAGTVYDKAVALEQYLRAIPYTLDLPAPPADQDIVDYFLFDIQQGYCDYYASSMVVMARHLGIPARLSVGYVTRNYDSEEERFVVTADQAHSWVEIYFPGYGWVTFEPTAGREEISRAPVRVQAPPTQQTYELVADKVANPLFEALPRVIGIALGIILLLALVYMQTSLWLLRRKDIPELFATLYRRVQWYGSNLGVEKVASDTPYEFSIVFRRALLDLSSGTGSQKRLERLEIQVDWLVKQYVSAVFSAKPPGPIERARALREWRGIRRRLLYALLVKKISNFMHRVREKRTFQEAV